MALQPYNLSPKFACGVLAQARALAPLMAIGGASSTGRDLLKNVKVKIRVARKAARVASPIKK